MRNNVGARYIAAHHPHSPLLIPNSSFPTPHSKSLTPNSSFLIPNSSFLIYTAEGILQRIGILP